MERDRPSLSVVIVTHDSREDIARSLPALVRELEPGDEIVVVDNASADDTPGFVQELASEARIVANHRNVGFAAAANQGVLASHGELVVLLNPDVVVAPGFGEAIRQPLVEGRRWDGWMGLVTQDGGRRVNSWGTEVHFTGLAWASGAGRPIGDAPAEPTEVGALSGALMAVPRPVWDRHGGFASAYFMYFEDVDLSLRIRLAGGRMGLVPSARADHAYEFEKGRRKWYLLERNRLSTIICCYPVGLLVTTAPALIVVEAAILVFAASRGWLREKLRADLDAARALPALLRRRRRIQGSRKAGARELAASLTYRLDSPYLGRAGASRVVDRLLAAYWQTALRVHRSRGPNAPPADDGPDPAGA